MSKDRYHNKRQRKSGRHRSFQPTSERNRYKLKPSQLKAPLLVTAPASEQESAVMTLIFAYIQRQLGWKAWKKLSYLEQIQIVLLLLVALGMTGATMSALSQMFSHVLVEAHTSPTQSCHIDLVSNTSLPCTLDATEQSLLPAAYSQTHVEPGTTSPIIESAVTPSIATAAKHHYFCPTLPFFKTNKLKTQQDAHLRLQTHGCSITTVNPGEKIRQGIMSSIEDPSNQQIKAFVENMMARKAYKKLNPIEFYLFQQVLIGKAHDEVASQLGSARCGSTSVAALFKIIEHYAQSTTHEPCPIIFMISAQGHCDVSLDEHPTESTVRIQEHAFLVSVAPNAIPADVLNDMIIKGIPTDSVSLASLESYNPEVCDPWQGKADTYQLSKVPLKYPNGEYSFWHPRAWKSTTVIGLFYLPPQSDLQLLLNPLFDESSKLSKQIKQEVSRIIHEINSALPDIVKDFLSLDDTRMTHGLRR